MFPRRPRHPSRIGAAFTYRVQFPDPGLYWYHPHIREDYAQEMGLSGPIVVHPSDPSYWAPADRELTITLDDILIEDGKMAPFRRSGPTFTAMGRFGNVMLINGETEFGDKAAVGEVVRLYLVNTANTTNLQCRSARRSDEDRRRRQWTLRARGVRRGGDAVTVGAGHRGRSLRDRRGRRASSIALRSMSTTSAASPWKGKHAVRRPLRSKSFESIPNSAS